MSSLYDGGIAFVRFESRVREYFEVGGGVEIGVCNVPVGGSSIFSL